MSWRLLRTLYVCELRLLLRDRRTLVFGLLLPTLVLPIFFFLSSRTQEKQVERLQQATYEYAIRGPLAKEARRWIELGSPAHSIPSATPPELALETEASSGAAAPGLTLQEVESTDPAAALDAGELHFYLEAREPFRGAVSESPARAGWRRPGAPGEALEVLVPRLRIVFRASSLPSSTAAGAMGRRLEIARAKLRQELLDTRGFPVPLEQFLPVEAVDVATAERRSGAALGRFAGLFLLLMMLSGGSVVAADTLAGEKERGTLETLLTTAAGRREIVAAKQLGILTVGLAICAWQLANLLVWVGLDVFPLPPEWSFSIDPAVVALVLLLVLPMAAVVSSLLLLVSGRARSYREFQVYFFPLFLVLVPLAGIATLPDLGLRSAVVLVPVANLSLALREVFVGEIDLPMLAVAWLVSATTALGLARWAWQALDTEGLVTRNDLDRGDLEGGSMLFARHVLWWFGGFWAILVVAVASVPWLMNLHAQLTFNLVILFLGGSLLLIWRYRLDPREVLSLRSPPHPTVWPAVVLGAPALLVGTLALARISEWLFPVPAALREGLTQMLLPPETPFVEILLLVAVLPGICEEIAFRGVLLHGLRDRLRPWQLCLVVGLIFAAFHLELSRFLPTAFVGAVLTAVTLRTRSIYPAMVWHMLSNASALTAERYDLPLDELSFPAYGAGLLVAGLALVWIWRVAKPAGEGAAVE